MIVLVVGGLDSKVGRARWPEGYVVRCAGGYREHATISGKFDAVVVLTKWVGHSSSDKVRRLRGVVPVISWNRGVDELAKNIAGLLPISK